MAEGNRVKARYPKNIKTGHKKDKPSGITERVIRVLGIYTLIAQNKFPSLNSLTEKKGRCNENGKNKR